MEKNTQHLEHYFSLIKFPLITEKTLDLSQQNVYSFILDKSLSKKSIKTIFETFFMIKIDEIKTCNLPVKMKRVGKFLGKKSNYKKAYIKLKSGYSLNEVFGKE
uniref:Ribosomal protein L23 n=1 Tax=Pedospumella sp. Jangsampo120217C5 TaxID=2782409 RepID=A0A7S6PV17_9STRA|nr:ribosomal protein L23 [Pedospumella sp. Jangsampo120217C5]|tara:strand:- start:649 stop:960 length:312 start_codon:yes stop_codon:yes gene_type:complete